MLPKNRILPHPGEILAKEFMKPLNLSGNSSGSIGTYGSGEWNFLRSLANNFRAVLVSVEGFH